MVTQDRFTTVKGYDYYEVVSALQKSIRRGKLEQAMYWGMELHESGFIGHAWNRLFIIATEDIGIANRGLQSELWSLRQIYDKINTGKKGKDVNYMHFTHAIVLMCKSKKSRLVDHISIAFYNLWRGTPKDLNTQFIPIPDYALDKHTKKGKAKGRDWKYFFSNGSLLEDGIETEEEVHWKDTAYEAHLVDSEGNAPEQLFPLIKLDVSNSVLHNNNISSGELF